MNGFRKGSGDLAEDRFIFTPKAVGQGTGLGLAIAYQIVVEKHGGAIAVVSALGPEQNL